MAKPGSYGLQAKWHVPGRIILVTSEAVVTMENLRHCNEFLLLMLEQGTAPVHIIFDSRQTRQYPLNVVSVRDTLTMLQHPNVGWLVSMTQDPFINFMGTVLANTFHLQMQSVRDLETAFQTLLSMDDTLRESTPLR